MLNSQPVLSIKPPGLATQPQPILVISDSARLAQVLALNLEDMGELIIVTIRETVLTPPQRSRWRLMIIALSAPEGEPIVALARAALLGRAWHPMPLLIISDRPFVAEPAQQLYHLLFPFDTTLLRRKVREILR